MFKPGDTGGISSSPIDLLFRPGMMIPYAGAAAPTGWLLADGSVVSQITYAALFAICGTTFNTGGEGAGNFRLPNPISRSVMGAGITAGLTSVAIGEKKGEETHVLLTGELATHNHGVTDPGHNHTQNAHTHTQDAHTHTQDAHTHTQNAHTHTQDAHTHSYSRFQLSAYSGTNPVDNSVNWYSGITDSPNVATTTATNQNTTATNQNTTATNQNTTATNQNTTATNNANTTGVTTNNEGSNTGHNTIHPVLGMTYIIKY